MPNSTYYDGDLRRDLLDAAVRQIAVEGPTGVSLRALAKQIGVSHAAPANHFRSKQALYTALATEGFARLSSAFESAVSTVDAESAVDVLHAGGRAYIDFGLDNPGYFAVMWRNDLLDNQDATLVAAGRRTFEFLVAGVGYAQSQGWAAGLDQEAVATTLWSAVHGFTALWLLGPLAEMLPRTREELTNQLTATLLSVGSS
ncbi:TetR/AcrR family transcriptional regulator [Euzebya tangerina]|uniref:TetR/AcrR family transcriptional regulator n=1 Tax=Euzebya tangerina TaxID=591198 RepID=UPI000E32054D|nr:TetR/AcrR family transcriptional regulator [Euzebya tangerina]